ncbi:hypothetical protein EBU95_13795 [bacterium]|nr:hypothetical protein [bacterium]
MKKLITTILAVIATITAHAQTTNTYVGTSGGNWNVATNWSQGALPTTNDPVLINANATVNVISPSFGGDITLNGSNARINVLGNPLNASNLLMTGAPGNNVRIFSDAGTINLGNGTGALSTAGGVTSWLTLNNGTSTLNLASANLTYFWLASSGAAATTTINSGTTINNAVTILGSANGSLATLNLNGGTFNAGDMYFNYANASSTAIVNLNGGATLTAGIISRGFDGSGEAFNWNDGTIRNRSGGSLTISRGANATQNMIISLAENGNHDFNVDSGRTITVSSTATLVNKTGEQGTLQKTGSGTLIFQGSNTYTGSTSVNGGTLLVNGSLLSSNTIVSTGATLGGSGSLQTVTLNGGTVSPGKCQQW